MGLLRHRSHEDDSPVVQRYQMREKLLSIGDDFWIEDESGDKVYKVNGKAVQVAPDVHPGGPERRRAGEDPGTQAQRPGQDADRMRAGRSATVHKAMLGIRDRYTIDPDNGENLHAHGNFVDHEYEIERDGETIATISKKWFRVRDTYGVEIGVSENQAFILAVTVCVDEMARG